ncbi:MAG: four-carbon acid sugar kinase family protein [Pseudomonadota bacterium]
MNLARNALPEGPLIAYYGDDVSGSTDVMEALSVAGLPTRLFLDPPDADALAETAHLKAIGIAGIARSQSPDWMDAELPPIIEGLRATGAPIIHYKVCSTGDSAPHVGSIGRAMEIGQDLCGGQAVPVVIGVPDLGRYVAFSNLFATQGRSAQTARIDRHPVMSRHPSTPMDEADLTRHLARQTPRTIGALDLRALRGPDPVAAYDAAAREAHAIVIDTVDDADSQAVGRLLWTLAERSDAPFFVIGSSGVEYGLARAWRASGALPVSGPPPVADTVDRLLVVSGSASPTSAAQIEAARADGWAEIPLDAAALVADEERVRRQAVSDLVAALEKGRSAIAHTACGPSDPRIAKTRTALTERGLGSDASAEILGSALGRIAAEVVERTGLVRIVLAGGDSAAHAARSMGLSSLELRAPLVPGSPLCRVVDGPHAGLEVVMKGGQIGPPDYYRMVLAGTVLRADAA